MGIHQIEFFRSDGRPYASRNGKPQAFQAIVMMMEAACSLVMS